MDLNDAFNLMTTRVRADPGGTEVQGSGFFFGAREPPDLDDPTWLELTETWVATNRHVILGDKHNGESAPNKVMVYLRAHAGTEREWIEILIEGEDLHDKVRFHPDKSIDVALINIRPYYKEQIHKYRRIMLPPSIFTYERDTKSPHEGITAGDGVLVIGYPLGVYDEDKLFPIIKSGIIASKWGADFRGEPYFLIDSVLFPGSSGSLVVSKPLEFAIRNNPFALAEENPVLLLGMYSGGYIMESRRQDGKNIEMDLGIVWYAHTMEETRVNGVSLTEALRSDHRLP